MEADLTALYQRRAEYFQGRWQRLPPFGDMVCDRWEKARLLGFGEGTSVYDSCLVIGEVRVGRHSWIGPDTILDGSGGGLIIGDYCHISAGVHIYTHDSVKWAVTGGRAAFERAPVSIGSRVHLGPGSVVSRGVTIGDQVIVGAGSLVKSSLASLTVAFGWPAAPAGRIIMNDTGDDFSIEYFDKN